MLSTGAIANPQKKSSLNHLESSLITFVNRLKRSLNPLKSSLITFLKGKNVRLTNLYLSSIVLFIKTLERVR